MKNTNFPNINIIRLYAEPKEKESILDISNGSIDDRHTGNSSCLLHPCWKTWRSSGNIFFYFSWDFGFCCLMFLLYLFSSIKKKKTLVITRKRNHGCRWNIIDVVDLFQLNQGLVFGCNIDLTKKNCEKKVSRYGRLPEYGVVVYMCIHILSVDWQYSWTQMRRHPTSIVCYFSTFIQ